MKKYIISALASLALILNAHTGNAQVSNYTGMQKGTSWEAFVEEMDRNSAALEAHGIYLDLAAAAVQSSDTIADFLASPTSSNLAAAMSDENGSGTVVFGTAPELTSATALTAFNPTTNDAAALGTTVLGWSDLFFATGATVHFANTDWVATHSTGVLTVGTGDLRITTAGTNAASAVTVGGTQTLTGKTLTSPVIGTGLTASGSAANTFAGSTGTFVTSTGANTLSGDVTVAAGKDIVYGTGDALFDASLGTGITKTTTGLNTFGGKAAFKVIATPVAATGAAGGVSGAAALGSANIVVVSSDGATKGVKLLTGVAGDIVHIINSSATGLNLFAASGGTINGGAADAGCAIAASTGVIAICTAADTWTVYASAAKSGAAN